MSIDICFGNGGHLHIEGAARIGSIEIVSHRPRYYRQPTRRQRIVSALTYPFRDFAERWENSSFNQRGEFLLRCFFGFLALLMAVLFFGGAYLGH